LPEDVIYTNNKTMPILPTPAERFATLLLWLSRAVDARRLGNQGGWLPVPLMMQIFNRIAEIRQRFARLAARIRAGKIYRRKPSAPRPGAGRPAGRANTLPSRSLWLLRLVPEAAAAAAQLRSLLAEPDMAALLAAAPGPAWRTIRPLCWMLGVEKPAILARPPPDPRPVPPRPARPVPPRPAAARAPKPPPPPRSPFHRVASAHWPRGVRTRPPTA
jgi:hypothetical protein